MRFVTMELVRKPVDQQRRCALYRHFDDQDVLLYVGITDSLGERTNSGHARSSDWVQFAVRAEAEWYDSREVAGKAERQAVEEETPVFNRQYALGDVDRRILEYLHAREIRVLSDNLATYFNAVQHFLADAPADDVAQAAASARDDFHCAGLSPRDVTFDAHVLRHLGKLSWYRSADAADEASAEAYAALIKFAGEKLEELRERRNPTEEPPF